MHTPAIRSVVLGALPLLAATAIAPAAVAGGSVHKSAITVQGFVATGATSFEVFGTVSSDTQRCVANRKVKLSARALSSDQFKPFDTARTSAKGGWAGVGESATGVDAIKAVLTQSKYGPKHHRSICGPDSETFIPDK